MSKPLAIAAAFSIFASSAFALFSPGSAHPSDSSPGIGASAGSTLAAPAISVKLPFSD